MEKDDFLKKLEKLVELAKGKHNTLDAGEINDFFAGDSLSPEQMDHIYSYLENRNIDVVPVLDEAMLKEAVETAKNADVAVIFAGLPDAFESEGYDREHMGMPDCQNYLIQEILKVQKSVVVVLHNGSPVEMPWAA